jgi:hypothetical protein
MIPTASFVMPSPKITLKSLGCYSYLTTATAATTSDEHIKLHISKISIIESSKLDENPVVRFILVNPPIQLMAHSPKENKKNCRMVENTPKMSTAPKFSKNIFLFMLNPDASTIGGRQK